MRSIVPHLARLRNGVLEQPLLEATPAVACLVSTAASMVPLVAPLSSPLAMGFFVGSQLLGLGMDVLECVYDIKRKNQQSAAGPKPPMAEQPASNPTRPTVG